MENYRFVKYFVILLGGMLFFGIAFFLSAYSDETTHPALTDEIVDHFNRFYPERALSVSQKKLVKLGSIEEDEETRWLRHFYDPVYNRGLVIGPREWESSKSWSQNTLAQATEDGVWKNKTYGSLFSLFSSDSDFSWERAVYEYAWGDKNRALLALGHVLHLIEDASVPDHTRNDPHPHITELFSISNASPYETWTKKFTPDNFILKPSEKPIILGNLNGYFDSMAEYSNRNFFSKDTIFAIDYLGPFVKFEKKEQLSSGLYARFGYGSILGADFRLVKLPSFFGWQKELEGSEEIESIEDGDKLILTDYWNLLSKQVVLHGAGVVKLFFDEVEKEKQTKTLYNKNRSWWQKSIDKFRETAFNTAGVLYGNSVKFSDLGSDEAVPVAPLADEKQNQQTNKNAAQDERVPPVTTGNNTTPPLLNTDAGVGGVRDGASALSARDKVLPPKPDPAIRNGGLLSGGASGGGSGPTSPSPAPPPPPPPDTTPPDITFSIRECGSSISSDGCFLLNPALRLSWSSDAGDFDHFDIACDVSGSPCANFSFSPTAATSTEYVTALEGKTYTFRAKAIDTTGNASAEAVRTAEIVGVPVVINEVAWAGTAASPADEWIELYNRTSKNISLSGWLLRSLTDDAPYLNVTGIIPAGGYYLIERTNDTAVSDIAADFVAPFGSGTGMGLLDSGEALALHYGSTTVDQTPAINACGFNVWCGGSTTERKTMERIDPGVSGADTTNWTSALGEFILNGKDAAGNPLTGTPKKRNSANYLISQNGVLAQNKTLAKSNSPYLIPRPGLTVPSGATLTIDPGVVIKIVSPNEPSLVVDGTIKANGTAADPVVFTSFADDQYGGDMNADGVCDPGNASSTASCPTPGSWKQILVNTGSTDSSFTHTIFRYGGRWFTNMTFRAMVVVDSASATFQSSTFENSQKHGLYLNASNSQVQNSIFRFNNADGDAAGAYIAGGSPTIQQNIFSNNRDGVYIGGSSPTVSTNIFSQNSNAAIIVSGSQPIFSGSTASNNGINGVLLQGGPMGNYTFMKDLPYVVDGIISLQSGKNFSASAGAVFKGKSSSSEIEVRGKFTAGGSSAEPVVFTSLADDTYGGDTNNDGLCDPANASSTAACPAVGNWGAISFYSTAASSTLNNVVVRYGASFCNGPCAAIYVNGMSLAIENATVEKNRFAGIQLENSASSTIASTIIRDHRATPGVGEAIGLKLTASTVTLDGVTFTNNDLGVSGNGVSSVLLGPSGVIFSGNTAASSPPTLIP